MRMCMIDFWVCRKMNSTTRLLMWGGNDKTCLNISDIPLLAKDQDRDLATLAIPRHYVVDRGREFMQFVKWPPRRAEKGMHAFLFGFSGEHIVHHDEYTGVQALSFAMPVASSSDRHFILHDESGIIHRFSDDPSRPLTRLGGISGSGVYVGSESPVANEELFFLGGFAYKAGDDLVFAIHADFINADGTIR